MYKFIHLMLLLQSDELQEIFSLLLSYSDLRSIWALFIISIENPVLIYQIHHFPKRMSIEKYIIYYYISYITSPFLFAAIEKLFLAQIICI